MSAPNAPEGADRRRWQFALSLVAWLTLVQSAVGVGAGILGTLLLSSPGITPYISSLAMLADAPQLELFDMMARQLHLLVRLQIPVSILGLIGGVGLLRRRRWGWYSVALLNLGGTLACLFYVPHLLKPLLLLLDAKSGATAAWLCALLLLLVPLGMLIFLFLGPVVRQFDRPTRPAG